MKGERNSRATNHPNGRVESGRYPHRWANWWTPGAVGKMEHGQTGNQRKVTFIYRRMLTMKCLGDYEWAMVSKNLNDLNSLTRVYDR